MTISAASTAKPMTNASTAEKTITKEDTLYNKYIIIRRGKKKYYIGVYE